MRKLLVSISLLIPAALWGAEKEFVIANESTHATEARVIALDAGVGARFAVEGPDGKHVPAWYDKKTKKVLVLSSVPAGGGVFKVLDGTPSRARNPIWGRPVTRKEGAVRLGKVVPRVSGSFDNNFLTVSVPADERVHGRVIIKSRNSDYKLELSPLGSSIGCVETEELGKKADESYRKGAKTNDDLFAILPSIATEIELSAPNPFQRRMLVKCYAWARKNNGRSLDLFRECGFEITLTWRSPVVKIRSWRHQDKTYWNHNGVMLNEIYIDRQPVFIQADGEEKPTERLLQGPALIIPFKQSLRLADKTGDTIVCQPDFKRLGIYRECVALSKNRLVTILSQSWGEGWKAIEIKAGTYEDTLTLACNVGKSNKSLKQWAAELE